MTIPSSHILVLTAAAGSGALDHSMLAAAEDMLGAFAASQPCWLNPGEALEIGFSPPSGQALDGLKASLERGVAGRPVDVNIVAGDPSGRRKRLLICDMDSTIIQQECIDEMADMAGIKAKVAAITERAMRGELDFEAALRERLGLLRGLGEEALESVFTDRISLMPGARVLTATMRAHGAFTALVSGGFSFFTSRVASTAGFEVNRANMLEISNGKLTGGVVGPILGREAKLEALLDYRTQLGLKPDQTMAVGDGANDLAMIGEAGLGVAFRAKPVVAAQAQASIVHADLTGLLYLQGYAREEFVTA